MSKGLGVGRSVQISNRPDTPVNQIAQLLVGASGNESSPLLVTPPVFQKFISQHINPFDAWIGLTDSDGSWKWVDGTDYNHGYK